MRYYYEDGVQGRVGPYEPVEIRELHLAGKIPLEAILISEDGTEALSLRELLARPTAGPLPSALAGHWASLESFTLQAGADLKALTPQLLLPLDELKSFRWLENRKLIAVACIGLLPLLVLALFSGHGDIQSAYWAIALYFSGLWAVFFYYVFPAPRITLGRACLCFFGTGFIALSILLLAYRFPPLKWMVQWTDSNVFLLHWLGYLAGVGIPEEMCKVLMLFFVWRSADPHPPHTTLFYGLMAGLGFGIYEGVDYQMNRNLGFAGGVGEYYLLNVLRLTTLPFLHAIWTGIAGYFLGFAFLYPQRRRGLYIVAIGLPALLHGTYDAAPSMDVKLVLALFSVLVLTLYLAKSVDFERMINRRETST